MGGWVGRTFTMNGRPKAKLILSEDEREQLQAWARRRKTAQALAQQSHIILACAEGHENQMVALKLGVIPQTMSKWRARFVEHPYHGE